MITSFFDKNTILTFNPPLSGNEGLKIIDLLFDSNERQNYVNYNYIRDIMANTEDSIGYIRLYDNHMTQFTLFSHRGEDIDKLNERLKWFEGSGYRMLDGYNVIPDVNQAFDKLYESEENEFDWVSDIVKPIEGKYPLVKVTDTGRRYPTHIQAMVYLDVTGAKELYDKTNGGSWRTHQPFIDGGYDIYSLEDFLIDKLPKLIIPSKNDICYLIDDKDFDSTYNTPIYKLVRVKDGGEFIMGDKGFEYINGIEDLKESEDDDFEWAKEIVNQSGENPEVRVNGKRFTMNQRGYEHWSDERTIKGWTNKYPVIGGRNYEGIDCYVIKLSQQYTVFIPVTEFSNKDYLRESEDDFDWAKDAVNEYEGLKGKPWHIDFDTDEDFIEIQKWLFKQGFRWNDADTKIEKTKGMKSIQSVWRDNVEDQTITRSNRWLYKDSLRTSLGDGLGKPIHIIWSDFIGRKNINENKMENPKSLLGLEFTLADEDLAGGFTVFTIDSVKEDFKGNPIIGISWVRNGKNQSTTYNLQTVLNALERGIWKLYTGDVWNKLDD